MGVQGNLLGNPVYVYYFNKVPYTIYTVHMVNSFDDTFTIDILTVVNGIGISKADPVVNDPVDPVKAIEEKIGRIEEVQEPKKVKHLFAKSYYFI